MLIIWYEHTITTDNFKKCLLYTMKHIQIHSKRDTNVISYFFLWYSYVLISFKKNSFCSKSKMLKGIIWDHDLWINSKHYKIYFFEIQ